MEHLVDLDELADRLRELVPAWERMATVSPFTWRDELSPWPQLITTDRSLVQLPESLGMRLNTGAGDQAEIIAWTGGWADVGLIVGGDELPSPLLRFVDVDGASAGVEQIVADFLSRANPDQPST